MKRVTFMFDAGERNNIQTYICDANTLDLTKEDYQSFEENHLDENAIKVMAFSFLTKQLFQDFSANVSNGDYEL